MTGRPVLGDFLRAAHQHLGTDVGRVEPEKEVFDVSASLDRLVAVMGRCVHDLTIDYRDLSPGKRGSLPPWAKATAEAQDALASAARVLAQDGAVRRAPTPPQTERGRRLAAAARSLAAGRDLLNTHFVTGTDGQRKPHSGWAAAITSRAGAHALLEETASLAGRAAALGAEVARSPLAPGSATADARRRLNLTCQWLWVADASVAAARRTDPVPAGGRELLHAIPLNAVAPRALPDGSEPVSALCEGITTASERICRTCWGTAERATWSPGMTVSSLRRAAMTSVMTAQNCRVVLSALARRTSLPGFPSLSVELSAAADSALRARVGWFQVVQHLGRFATDVRGYQSQTATECGDLALWTGRLAHADPGWTLADGAASPQRAPERLAATPQDVPAVVAAVHQACETLATLAQAEQEQIRQAARAGRLLVPTLSMPETFDIPYPFTTAPPDRVKALASTYRAAGQASREAGTQAGRIAAAVEAPSWPLASARAAVQADQESERAREAGDAPPPEEDADPGLPGLVERTLLDLGVTRARLLQRGAKLDHASQQLIIAAATDPHRSGRHADAAALRRPPGTDALINSALASCDPRAAALLRRPSQAQREAPEPEA